MSQFDFVLHIIYQLKPFDVNQVSVKNYYDLISNKPHLKKQRFKSQIEKKNVIFTMLLIIICIMV